MSVVLNAGPAAQVPYLLTIGHAEGPPAGQTVAWRLPRSLAVRSVQERSNFRKRKGEPDETDPSRIVL